MTISFPRSSGRVRSRHWMSEPSCGDRSPRRRRIARRGGRPAPPCRFPPAIEVPRRQPAQLAVDHGKQAFERALVAVPPFREPPRYVACRGTAHSYDFRNIHLSWCFDSPQGGTASTAVTAPARAGYITGDAVHIPRLAGSAPGSAPRSGSRSAQAPGRTVYIPRGPGYRTASRGNPRGTTDSIKRRSVSIRGNVAYIPARAIYGSGTSASGPGW